MDGKSLSDVLRSENQDDFVEYFIFPTNISDILVKSGACSRTESRQKSGFQQNGGSDTKQAEGGIGENGHPSLKEDANQTHQFNELFLTINASVLSLIGDYLWQKEPFVLRKILSSGASKDEQNAGVPYFHGLTRYGENVEDEWFIVYILLKLTEQFPDIIIRVADNDGEFLLIEAANDLPDWAESDSTCLQRVYIYRGKIHIIPIPSAASNGSEEMLRILPAGPPTISEIINIITKYPHATLASDAIQRTILARIGNYPNKITSSFQHSNMMLPPKLALILKLRPDLVSAAVQAFYYRDPIDMKTARFMKHFKPGDSLVKTRVRLTKTMHAMLSKQDYRPDPKVGWGFPRPTSCEFKGHSLGAKLTTGFEILLSRPNPICSNTISSNQSAEEIPTTKTWVRYNEKLKSLGYYRDYLEFSKPYMELEEKAKMFFSKNHEASLGHSLGCPGSGDLGDMSCCSSEFMLNEDLAVHELQHLVKTITHVDFEALKKESFALPPDDDDSWLEVNPDDFETMLEAQFQTKVLDFKLEEIPTKLKQFMSQKSNLEGVEVPKKGKITGLEQVNGFLEPMPRNTIQDEPLDFRADDFVDAMDKLLLDMQKKEAEWDPSEDDSFSDEEEYLNFEEIKKKYPFSKNSKIHQLMKRMDEELASTEVGRTYSDSSPSTSSAGPSTSRGAAAVIASTSSSNTATPIDEDPKEPDEFDDIEAFEPVQVDLYTLKNMLESFRNQDTPFGPSSNLLRGVGFDISKAKK